MYWFYILKEVNSSNDWRGSENIEKDVFIASDREVAKKTSTSFISRPTFP